MALVACVLCVCVSPGKRRYDMKQAGFGGQTKPVFHKKVCVDGRTWREGPSPEIMDATGILRGGRWVDVHIKFL